MPIVAKITAGFCAALLVAVVAFAVDGQSTVAGQAPETITPTQALNKGSAADGKVFKVEGTLENAGSNYFTDSRLVLIAPDRTGQIDVQAWLPTSAPGPAAGGKPRREVLSDYLGKTVVLTGKVTIQPVKGVGVTKVLVVQEADVSPKQ